MNSTIRVCALVAVALSLLWGGLAWADASDLAWSTFLGGSSSDWGDGDLDVDALGNVYLIGTTASADFPVTTGAFDEILDLSDAFVAKLDPTGSVLVYATFLGGNSPEYGHGIAVDDDGNAYATGLTNSIDFPTTPEAFDTSYNFLPDSIAYFDAFVSKLNPSGSDLVFSTFLGGREGDETGYGIDVDASGHAYVTGGGWGFDFPVTPGAFDTSYDRYGDIFVTKFDPSGSDLEYSTFLGGSENEFAFGMVVDGSGCAYVTGNTKSPDFPVTAGAFDVTHNGDFDGFVAKLNSAGSDLVFATFLGGAGEDWGFGIDIDDLGRAHVAGQTDSTLFPTTAGAFDISHNGAVDAFVAKLNPAGTALEYSTFLGGGADDNGWGIAVDDSGNAYVNGQTSSADFPATAGAFQTTYHGVMDAFLARLNPSGNILQYATYLGGSSWDWGNLGIGLGGPCEVYITGGTCSADFPATPGAFDETYNFNDDVFVAKFDLSDYFTPVVLASFQAIGSQGSIALNWVTASEIDCHGWEIYRSDLEEGDYIRIAELPGRGSVETTHTYHWVDRQVQPEATYFYKLRQVDFDGSSWWSPVVSAASSAIPGTYALSQNYPNPFNANTEIRYHIPLDEHVTLKVFNSLGQEVRILVDVNQVANEYAVIWDGRDDGGQEAASGLYFCRLQAGAFEKIVKMMLVR
jgi:hypothetical protein